jgi:hypothetical protein
MKKRKLTKDERQKMNERHKRMDENIRRTRELAEKAQAKLDAAKPRE